ncbi:hypothetical protein CEXT_40831 [Caerostris extrusa]|uniref:Uncharacterized protein n=1 Tax=Caerostris extrusa TaxID=172846 RepID=A0AAV4Y728_CAEEX|nr:hypothetical protein CEXT_40831 [Caerostris extrusa]
MILERTLIELKKKRDKERKTGESRDAKDQPLPCAHSRSEVGFFIAWETSDRAVASGRGSSHFPAHEFCAPRCQVGRSCDFKSYFCG